MTEDEQILICKTITQSCMWGYSGVGSVILDRLDKLLPMPRKWQTVHDEHAKAAKHEAVGVVRDEADLKDYLKRGYTLCNYQPGELSLFYPYKGGGLAKYVLGELAEHYGQIHDPWNYGIHNK